MKTKKLFIASLLVASIINTGCKKSSSSTDAGASSGSSGSSAPSLTHYITSCTTTTSAIYTANSYKSWLQFTGSTYSWSQLYFSDSGCATPAFTLSTSGTFSEGAATSSPVGGYLINFTPTSSSVTTYNSLAATFNTYCGAHWTVAATATYNSTSAGLSCSLLGLVPANTVIYNAFVVNGSTLSLGAFTQNNPGVTVSSGVATSTSVDIPVY